MLSLARSVRVVLCCAVASSLLVWVSSSWAVGTTQVVVHTGDATPDANGSFSSFSSPVLNDAGQVAFRSILTGTSGGSSDDWGIFRGDGTTLVQIVRRGDAAPDANGSFFIFGSPALNDAGQAAFRGSLTGTSGGISDDNGIFQGDGAALVQIAREGEAAPDANGSFSHFFNLAFNDAGQAAFRSILTGTSGGSSDDWGIFRGDGTTLVQIVRRGDAAPDANGSFSDFFTNPVINDAGQAAFEGNLIGTGGGSSDDRGIFRGDGATLTQIAREGDAAPDANGSFSGLGSLALNDVGQVAFLGTLAGTSGGTSDDRGIFRGDGTTLTQIAREGDAAPDTNGSFAGFLATPALNNAGQAAFRATLTGTSGGTSDNEGIFRSDGAALVQIVREGETAPDANGSFSFLTTPALNDAGQAAFRGSLTGTSGGISDDNGIFFYDDGLGLIQVSREGDALLGSTITSLLLGFSSGDDEQSGLNALGQVAYRFNLADGRSGIAVWTVPEPTALALLTTLGGTLLLARRRRN